MKVIKEYDSAEEFLFWGGARSIYDRLAELGLTEKLWYCIEQNFADCETPTETQINDFVWFENDVIKDFIGFDFWEYASAEEAEDDELFNDEDE